MDLNRAGARTPPVDYLVVDEAQFLDRAPRSTSPGLVDLPRGQELRLVDDQILHRARVPHHPVRGPSRR